MASSRVLLLLTLLVVVTTLWNTLWMFEKSGLFNAKVSGTTSFCIDQPPIISVSCDDNLTQGDPYNCTINASDADNDSLIFSSSFITNRTVFNITSYGLINFTPVDADVGNHSVNLTVDDSKGCNISVDSEVFNFSVDNINDAPYLSLAIPDQSFTESTTIAAFFLNDHFTDPDDDTLTYTKTNTNKISITITSGSEVLITASDCPATESVIFTATDPYNLSAESNVVEITCTESTSGSGEGSTSSGGGGGGGGGSSSTLSECKKEMECFDYTDCYPNGTQSRNCLDLAGCTDRILVVWRDCVYIEECFNGLQDEFEEGVDCGGPCKPCESCFDGILNQDEVDVDCGGSCQPCEHCTDGIQNFDETGIDCGGSCPACATCNDGIQNQGEEGVDCGGPCDACTDIEVPAFITDGFPWMRWLIILIVVLIVLLTTYRYTHKYFDGYIKAWIDNHNKVRPIYLQNVHSSDFLLSLNNLEVKAKKNLTNIELNEYFNLARDFLAHLIHIKREFTSHEIQSNIQGLEKNIKEIVSEFSEIIIDSEIDHKTTDKYSFFNKIEILRSMILIVSPYSKDIVKRDIVESVPDKNISIADKFFVELSNIVVALQFREYEVVKEKYKKIYKKYEALSHKNKKAVYSSLNLVFNMWQYDEPLSKLEERFKHIKKIKSKQKIKHNTYQKQQTNKKPNPKDQNQGNSKNKNNHQKENNNVK